MVKPTVYLVEDDEDVRDSLMWILAREGLEVKAFTTAPEMLQSYDPKKLGCLVLDLYLPGMSGLELCRRLAEMGCRHPFIILTGHAEVSDVTEAMKMGAFDFLEKPLDDKALVQCVWNAIDQDVIRRRKQEEYDSIQARIDALSPREREVLDLVVAGKLSKQIARQLGVTIKTIEAHRSHITKKMQVESVAQLVQLVTKHNLLHPTGIIPDPHHASVPNKRPGASQKTSEGPNSR